MKTSTMEEWALEKAWGLGFRFLTIDPSQNAVGPNLALVWQEDVEKLEDALMSTSSPHPPAKMMNPPVPVANAVSGTEKFTKIHKGQACYWLRHTGKTWSEISQATGSSISNAPTLAKNYAKANNKPWPIPKHEKQA